MTKRVQIHPCRGQIKLNSQSRRSSSVIERNFVVSAGVRQLIDKDNREPRWTAQFAQSEAIPSATSSSTIAKECLPGETCALGVGIRASDISHFRRHSLQANVIILFSRLISTPLTRFFVRSPGEHEAIELRMSSKRSAKSATVISSV